MHEDKIRQVEMDRQEKIRDDKHEEMSWVTQENKKL